jgi:hypothetical protein
MSRDEFFVNGGDHTRLAFLHDEAGKLTGLVLNPGPGRSRAGGSTDRDKNETRRVVFDCPIPGET